MTLSGVGQIEFRFRGNYLIHMPVSMRILSVWGPYGLTFVNIIPKPIKMPVAYSWSAITHLLFQE
jgi:hypothetical protein